MRERKLPRKGPGLCLSTLLRVGFSVFLFVDTSYPLSPAYANTRACVFGVWCVCVGWGGVGGMEVGRDGGKEEWREAGTEGGKERGCTRSCSGRNELHLHSRAEQVGASCCAPPLGPLGRNPLTGTRVALRLRELFASSCRAARRCVALPVDALAVRPRGRSPQHPTGCHCPWVLGQGHTVVGSSEAGGRVRWSSKTSRRARAGR